MACELDISHLSPTSTHTATPRSNRQGALKRHRLSHYGITPLRNNDITPIEKLRRILRSIRIIVEVCLALKRCVNEKAGEENLSLVEMQMNLQDDFSRNLTFNPHYYSASYIANKGSSNLKKLLAISPEARSKRHVKMVQNLVQNKPAFSKHPLHIRLKMCQVMIYQSYEARRVIIKQGHPPSAFYIILSGTCLVNERVMSTGGRESVQTINEIKEGDVFGEVALLNGTTRTASVVCKTNVELLVVSKEDFDAIIRGPIYKQREEVIDYCRSLHILRDWPVDKLATASFTNFYYQYFRKGSIVVRDNADSNFLVFIKSGECSVVCTLGGRGRVINIAPNLPIVTSQRKTTKRISAAGRLQFDATLREHQIPRRTTAITSRSLDAISENDITGVTRNRKIPKLQRPRRPIRQSVVEDTPYTVRINPRDRWKRAAKIASLFHNSPPKFARIANLYPKCVFGLEEMMRRTDLRLSLLSNGAECIFISTKMFMNHASPRCIREVQGAVGRYPTENYIRSQLREQSHWTDFKKCVITDIVGKKKTNPESSSG